MKALCNARVFDGDRMLDRHTVFVDCGRVVSVVPEPSGVDPIADAVDLDGLIIAPGFIDTQVNGGADVLFNDEPSSEGIARIIAAHRRHGTTGLLPTLISDDRAVMERALSAVAEARRAGMPGLLGIHLEGPYLNPKRKGIHREEKIRTPEPDAVALLSRLGDEATTLVTVAPERVREGFIAELSERGVIVAAGHTAGTYADIRRAQSEGLRGFTHLFNAMTPMTSREPGVVGAALAGENTWCGLIVDGHHVHPATARVAVSAKMRGRIMLVTDAVHAAGSTHRELEFLGQTIYRANGRVTSATGTLAGSDLTMDRAVRNVVDLLALPLEEALRMASLYPAAFLGIDAEYGRIRPGYRADFVALDDDLRVVGTWIDGEADSDAPAAAPARIGVGSGPG